MAVGGVKVLKFGGTSMGSSAAMKRVIAIVKRPQRDARPVRGKTVQRSAGESRTSNGARIAAVIVSAMSGVTDELIKIAHRAAAQDGSHAALLKRLEERHIKTVEQLVSRKNRTNALAHARMLFGHLNEVVTGIKLVRELSPGALDYVVSYGERLSAHILCDALNDRGVKCEYLNARNVVTTDGNFGEAAIDFIATNRAIKKYFKSHDKLQIVTGYIGASPDKKTTTLGRGGSDYSVAIFGAALSARVIEIWTDVSGVMTADPRKVKDAKTIPQMTYQEAVEMSYFGAKVIHPPTMRPAQEKDIPIIIKNTFEPDEPGTLITRTARSADDLVRGISSAEGTAMLQVEGSGMLRARGASGRLFGALARARVNVLLITQASSQNSISFAVRENDVESARAAIHEEFAAERAAHLIDEVRVTRGLSIIAIVGEGMRHRHGVAGRLFYMLGKNGINVVAIAQGSSELSISIVVASSDEAKALNVLHTGFFFPETKPINIFLVGVGLIGSRLLLQIARQREFLKREHGFSIKIIGIGNHRTMLLDEEGIAPERGAALLKASKTKMNLKNFIEAMKQIDMPGKVMVDCTASDDVAASYAGVLGSQISVVTPNKRANSGPLEYYRELRELAKQPGVSFLYETNVCAALPIISMLDDLTLSGDRIKKIEGVFSGTLSYIFSTFTGEKPFSEVVADAKRLGFTEPDPRQDLNGMDVARKILILARKCGLPLELGDVRVESLLSKRAQRAKSIENFFEVLKDDDARFEKRRKAAEKEGKRLRYIATFEKGRASVALRAYPLTHPFYELSGSDNIVLITSGWYSKTPLLIQGPGAGADVTAAGVFADILRTARDIV